MKNFLDPQQIELLGTAHLEAMLIKEGFEVAKPIRDKGIDLIAFRDITDQDFRAVPIQVKAASESAFYINKKYMGRNIIMAYVWHVLQSPRIFLVPYDEAVMLLPEKTRATNSWSEKGIWAITRPGREITRALEQYENRYDLLI